MYLSKLNLIQTRPNQGFQFINISDIEKHISNPYESKKWGVYGIIWTGSSPYTHEFDGKLFTIPPNHFLFISPHKTNNFVTAEHPDATLLLFNSVFFARSTREAFILQATPLFHKTDHVFYYENCIYGKLDLREIVSKILNEALNEEIEGLYGDLAHSILSIIILFAMTKLSDGEPNYNSDIEESNDYSLALAFREKVFKNFKQERTVSFYAEALNVSPRKLTSACKKAFNKTAKDLITEIVFDAATRMLSNSDLNIKEITFDLGFTEETNFIAFFKKHTDITPHNYRKHYNKHRLFSKYP